MKQEKVCELLSLQADSLSVLKMNEHLYAVQVANFGKTAITQMLDSLN